MNIHHNKGKDNIRTYYITDFFKLLIFVSLLNYAKEPVAQMGCDMTREENYVSK